MQCQPQADSEIAADHAEDHNLVCAGTASEAGSTPLASSPSLLVDFYEEDRAWSAIAVALARIGVAVDNTLADTASAATMLAAVEHSGLVPFASITTHRTRFSVALKCGHTVNIDFDVVDFSARSDGTGIAGYLSDSSYTVAEVELVSSAASESSDPGRFKLEARAALAMALEELGVAEGSAPVRGKVLEFLHRYDPARWQTLSEAGLLEQKLGLSSNESSANQTY
jgi:hypothetical protein